MFGIIAIIAIIGIALLINHLLGSMGTGLVALFEKIGIGKAGAYIFGGCLFLVILYFLKFVINSYII